MPSIFEKLSMRAYLRIIIFILSIFCLQSCNTTGPDDENGIPGRRDYEWTIDTLWADDFFGLTDAWASSPNSIWITAVGTSSKDCLWNYDGIKWSESVTVFSL